MGSARNILYGFASALLLFSVAVAIQQSYLGHLNSVIAASQPQRNAKPGVPGTSAWAPLGRGSSVFSEREAWTDVAPDARQVDPSRSEEHTSELQSLAYLVCRLLLEKKKKRTVHVPLL